MEYRQLAKSVTWRTGFKSPPRIQFPRRWLTGVARRRRGATTRTKRNLTDTFDFATLYAGASAAGLAAAAVGATIFAVVIGARWVKKLLRAAQANPGRPASASRWPAWLWPGAPLAGRIRFIPSCPASGSGGWFHNPPLLVVVFRNLGQHLDRHWSFLAGQGRQRGPQQKGQMNHANRMLRHWLLLSALVCSKL